MKTILISTILSLLFACPEAICNDQQYAQGYGDFHDPRQLIEFYENTRNGEEIDRVRHISKSILIIHWMTPPREFSDFKEGNTDFDNYQISGIEGYHRLTTVERFVEEFYKLDPAKISHSKRLNIIVAGNNWGAGKQLIDLLKPISKKHSISVYFAGGWTFQKAKLIKEPPARLELIRKAFKLANSEQ